MPTTPARPVGCGAEAARLAEGPRTVAKGEAHVWLVDLAEPSIPTVLSTSERMRADALRVPAKREEWIKARGAMRAVLASYLGVARDEIVFDTDSRGKPFIVSPRNTGISFNISHSNGKLAVIVTKQRDVGVDIEKHNLARNWEGLAPRVFSPAERRYLATQPPERAYQIWTLKEAILKATGTGVDRDLTTFSVVDERGRPAFSGNIEHGYTPHFSEALTDRFAGFDLAIVSEGDAPLRLNFFEWR